MLESGLFAKITVVNWQNSADQFLFAHDLYVLITLVVSAWLLSDMNYIHRWKQQKVRLELDGKWDDLETHFQRRLKTRRLFARLFQRFAVPGNLEASYALYLHNRGRSEAALETAERAIVLAQHQPSFLKSTFGRPARKTLQSAMHTRVLVLNGLGRYEEARATSAEMRALPGGKTHATACLTELHAGHLDEALILACETLSHDPKDGTARLVASSVFCYRREFAEAINILIYEPKDFTEHYSRKDLALALRNRESATFIALKRKHSATIHQPIWLLSAARVYIDQGDLDEAIQALDMTEPLLGANPVIRCAYHRYRALCAATKGDIQQTEQHLAEARSITQSLPKRDTQWETSVAAGRCYLTLRLTDKATLELQEAQRHALHPIEKHVTNYWLARTADAAKRRSEARRHYQDVVADNIPTRMRDESFAALDRLK